MALQESCSDVELVEACLAGEAQAWEILVRRYANLVYAVARRYGLDADDAADVFQNTWSALWEGLADVRDRARLAPWLIRVCGRLSFQQVERRHRQLLRRGSEAEIHSRPDPDPLPDEVAIENEETERVQKALARLPDRCRQFLECLFYDPTSPTYAEIARRLGVSPDTLGPLRGRCLNQLRRLLQSEEIGRGV